MELERAVYSFTALGCDPCDGNVYSLRYDMSALLALEKRGLSWRDVFAPSITGEVICAFLTAGGTERSAALQLVKADARGAWGQCKRAMLLALPVRDPDVLGVQRPADGNPDMKRLRCLICDVMRKPEEFFWASTLRELIERWQAFAAAKGYAKEPERVVRFDTEGME